MTQTVLLGDIAADGRSVISGPFGSSISSKYFTESGVPVIRGNNLSIVSGKKFIDSGFVFVSRDKANELKAYAHKDDIILTAAGTLGQVGIIPDEATYEDYVISNKQIRVTVDPKKARPLFVYYALSNPIAKKLIESMNTGSTIPLINLGIVKRLPIPNLDLETQDKIIDVVGGIDEKIELNRRINETLEQMGQALFRHYFIDNPEAERWNDGIMGDIIVNFDSKRKPVSSRQRAEMRGEYRYFGATSVMDYVNDYLFDGKYLLLAEDGSVIKGDGTPYLQYVWGKFWVNNHAHILQAKDPYTVEYLYLLLSQSNVQSLVSGAVQLKINQRAMNNFRVKLPPHNLVKEFCEKIDPMFAQRRKNEDEIQTLTTLRDTLLPRLISGKVRA